MIEKMKINLEKAKQEFLEYTNKYDKTHPKIARKIGHSLRVMDISREIAKSLELTDEQINVATIIGLLHDIGKLEQIKQYNTTKDITDFDHGEVGVEILEKDMYIRKYIEESKYDDIIFKAIKNHNRLDIEHGLNNEELLFAKIIRDADKMDIFYEGAEMFWTKEEEVRTIEESTISDIMFDNFCKNIKGARTFIETPIDGIIDFISMIFDINFQYDFNVLEEKGYINQIFDKFDCKEKKTKEQFAEIRRVANEYISGKTQK